MVFIAFRLRSVLHPRGDTCQREKNVRALFGSLFFFRYEIMALSCWLLPPKVIHSRPPSHLSSFSPENFTAICAQYFSRCFRFTFFSLVLNINTILHISKFYFFLWYQKFSVYFYPPPPPLTLLCVVPVMRRVSSAPRRFLLLYDCKKLCSLPWSFSCGCFMFERFWWNWLKSSSSSSLFGCFKKVFINASRLSWQL